MSALGKDILRSIIKGRKRFLAIALITTLGVMMFSGLQASCMDLRRSADQFFDEQRLHDLTIVSTLGLTDADVEVLQSLPETETVEGVYRLDATAMISGTEYDIALETIRDGMLDVPYLVSGRLPKTEQEAVVTEVFLRDTETQVGDTVTVIEEVEEDEDPILRETTFTITGMVVDVRDINNPHGSTAFRGGLNITPLMYVLPEAFTEQDVFTSIRLTIDGMREAFAYADAYKDPVRAFREYIEGEIKTDREQARYDALIAEATEKIDDAEKEAEEELADAYRELTDAKEEFETEIADAEKEIADAEKEVRDGSKELADAEQEVADGEIELAEKEQEAREEIAKARQEIADGRRELNEAWSELVKAEEELNRGKEQLEEGKNTLQSKESSALEQIAAAREQAQAGLQQAQAGKAQAEAGLAQAEEGKAQATQKLTEAQGALQQLEQIPEDLRSEEQKAQIVTLTATIPTIEATITKIEAQIKTARAGAEEAQAGIDAAEAGLKEIDAQEASALGQIAAGREEIRQREAEIAHAEEKIAEGWAEYDKGLKELEDGEKELNEKEAEAEQEIADAKQEIADAKEEIEKNKRKLRDARKEIADAKIDLEEGRAEGAEKIADAEKEYEEGKQEAEEEIQKARDELDDIDMATWYVSDRNAMNGYNNTGSDADAIEAIGTVFPVVFFFVAILISLTAVTRMVEEDRGLIGTYKALGYRDAQIQRKYLVFTAAAGAIGAVLGTILAFIALPAFLFSIFDIMYVLPYYHASFLATYGIAGPLLFIGGILVAAYRACRRTLKAVPAALMRPKTPKNGSRVLLERVTPVWKRLSFLNKVTARNIFRYKKRMMMTIFGIAGCMALLLFGFAIRDSVGDLMPRQYEETSLYDLMIVGETDLEEDVKGLTEYLKEDEEIETYLPAMITTVKLQNADREELSSQLVVVPDGEALGTYIAMINKKGEVLALSDGDIYATRNASEMLSFDDGDTLRIQLVDLQTSERTVSAVVRNYLGNSVYMTRATYEETFSEYEENGALVHVREDVTDIESYRARFAEREGIMSCVGTEQMKRQFNQAFLLMNSVVYIVIAMSAALAFAVLFTLATTNISERERELATIKVLGFYDREVHLYVDKETLLLVGIGIVFGAPLGYLFAQTLPVILRLPAMYLRASLHGISYLYAVALTLVFTFLVNFLTDRILDRINPVEALKSVE